MGETTGSKRKASGDSPYENPLVPNQKMKQMYEGIVESRMLADMIRKRYKKLSLPDTQGQEACRVSVLIGLDPDDLISDIPFSIETPFLRGVPPQKIVGDLNALTSGKKKNVGTAKLTLSSLLPAIANTADRFKIALGAALTIKQLKLHRTVILFAGSSDLKLSTWHKSLKFAAQHELPIFFVILPDPVTKPSKQTPLYKLCKLASNAGVPGIPVDASDAIALYRIAQESMGRMRGGDGPVLMECISFFADRDKSKRAQNPITIMSQSLIARKIATQQWLSDVTTAFQACLSAL